jgi:hypothetical protein
MHTLKFITGSTALAATFAAAGAFAQTSFGGHSLVIPLRQDVKSNGDYGNLLIYVGLDGGKPEPIFIDTGSQQLNINYAPSFWPGTPVEILKPPVDMFEGFGNGKSGYIYRPVSARVALYAAPVGGAAPKLVYRLPQPVPVGKKLADFQNRSCKKGQPCTYTRKPLGISKSSFGIFGASALNGIETASTGQKVDMQPILSYITDPGDGKAGAGFVVAANGGKHGPCFEVGLNDAIRKQFPYTFPVTTQGDVPFPNTGYAPKKSSFGIVDVTIDNVRDKSLPTISFKSVIYPDTGGNHNVGVMVPGLDATNFQKYSDSKNKRSRNTLPGTRMRLHASNGFSYTYVVPDHYNSVGRALVINNVGAADSSPKRGPLIKLNLAFYRDVAVMTDWAHGTVSFDPKPFDCISY